MQQKDALALLKKYREGLATEEEIAMLDMWYLNWKKDEAFELTEEDYLTAEAAMLSRLPVAEPVVKRRISLWPKIAAAAAILVVVGVGLFFYTDMFRHPELVLLRSSDGSGSLDIAPGKQGATLTLADGSTIVLTEAAKGKLATQAGVNVTKTEDGQLVYEIKDNTSRNPELNPELSSGAGSQYNTLTTAKGETYQVRLPDGTSVWLNAASTLKYPASFAAHKNRRVELSGEGYFEVAKDKAHPFIVQTDKQEVEVLGTHFNISSYADEANTKTTLLEGSVRVSIESSSSRHLDDRRDLLNSKNKRSLPAVRDDVILKPGDQATLIGSAIKVKQTDPQDAILWKNGKFSFNSEEMGSVMRKVARWYNVEVIFKDPLQSEKVSGSVSRFANMSTLLQKLEEAGGVHFKIEERTIIVTK